MTRYLLEWSADGRSWLTASPWSEVEAARFRELGFFVRKFEVTS